MIGVNKCDLLATSQMNTVKKWGASAQRAKEGVYSSSGVASRREHKLKSEKSQTPRTRCRTGWLKSSLTTPRKGVVSSASQVCNLAKVKQAIKRAMNEDKSAETVCGLSRISSKSLTLLNMHIQKHSKKFQSTKPKKYSTRKHFSSLSEKKNYILSLPSNKSFIH